MPVNLLQAGVLGVTGDGQHPQTVPASELPAVVVGRVELGDPRHRVRGDLRQARVLEILRHFLHRFLPGCKIFPSFLRQSLF